MLNIVIEETKEAVGICLEGRLTGSGADELGQAWARLAPVVNARKVFVDVCNVTYMDAEGRGVLGAIYMTGAAVQLGGMRSTNLTLNMFAPALGGHDCIWSQ